MGTIAVNNTNYINTVAYVFSYGEPIKGVVWQ